MRNKKQLRPAISISTIGDRIIINKDIIAYLDSPSFICLLENKYKDSIAITGCDSKISMSFKVPDGFLTLHKTFSINSKAFAERYIKINNLKENVTYRIYGKPLKENESVLIFRMKDAIPRENGKFTIVD